MCLFIHTHTHTHRDRAQTNPQYVYIHTHTHTHTHYTRTVRKLIRIIQGDYVHYSPYMGSGLYTIARIWVLLYTKALFCLYCRSLLPL
jgi:hypothetical protein